MDPPYMEVVAGLLSAGSTRVSSRYGYTRERLGTTVKVWAGEYPIRPGMNSKIGVLEGLFLVGETYSQKAVEAVAPRADLSLFTERGAYGPRIESQLEFLVRGLEKDPSSRQHTLMIARPGDQYTSDMPCTLALHFLVRSAVVHCFASMRSSDVLKGLPTDLIQFGLLTHVIANCFDYRPGYVHLTSASQHLYLDDVTRAPVKEVTRRLGVRPMFVGTPLARYRDFREWARAAVAAAPWDGKLPRGVVEI